MYLRLYTWWVKLQIEQVMRTALRHKRNSVMNSMISVLGFYLTSLLCCCTTAPKVFLLLTEPLKLCYVMWMSLFKFCDVKIRRQYSRKQSRKKNDAAKSYRATLSSKRMFKLQEKSPLVLYLTINSYLCSKIVRALMAFFELGRMTDDT